MSTFGEFVRVIGKPIRLGDKVVILDRLEIEENGTDERMRCEFVAFKCPPIEASGALPPGAFLLGEAPEIILLPEPHL